MSRATTMTEEEMDLEIARLKQSQYVKKAQQQVNKSRPAVDPKRKKLYQLRWLEKKGRALAAQAEGGKDGVR